MCNKEHLVAYLYDDLTASDRASFEAHVERCAACRGELEELQATRQHLTSWAPPEPRIDLRVVGREPAAPRRAPMAPAWALAAAASLLLLAGAAAIANVELRVGSEGVVVRTGWGAPAGEPAAGSGPLEGQGGIAGADLAAELQELRARLRELEGQAATHALAPTPVVATDAVSVTDATEALEGRLRGMIADSERRQRTDVAVQMTQMWKDLNAVRASDFVRVQESLERVQGQTNYQLRRQRDQLQSQLYRVSLQK